MANKFGKLARRYAQAFLRVVESEQGRDGEPSPAQSAARQLADFASIWRRDSSLASGVLNPMFPADQRLNALLGVAGLYQLSDINKRFLKGLFERDRIAALEEVAQAFVTLADSTSGMVNVEVTTARHVNDDERHSLREKLVSTLGNKLDVSWSIDPALIGGIVVQYNGKVFDGSLQGRLSRMEQELLRTA